MLCRAVATSKFTRITSVLLQRHERINIKNKISVYFGIKSSVNVFICRNDETVTPNDQDAVSLALSVLIKLEILQEEIVPIETARDWNML